MASTPSPSSCFFSINSLLVTTQRKSHVCIPKKGIAWSQSQFYIGVSVRDLYTSRIGPHIFLQQNMQTDPGNI
jgi:hypothetical protein